MSTTFPHDGYRFLNFPSVIQRLSLCYTDHSCFFQDKNPQIFQEGKSPQDKAVCFAFTPTEKPEIFPPTL